MNDDDDDACIACLHGHNKKYGFCMLHSVASYSMIYLPTLTYYT